MTIVCTSDTKYLPLFTVMLNSVCKNSPETHVHCRLVNIDPKLITTYDNVSYTIDNTNLSVENNILIKDWSINLDSELDRSQSPAFPTYKRIYSQLASYCTNIKYDTIYKLMEKDTDDVYLYIDVDTIVRKNLYQLDTAMFLAVADIGVVLNLKDDDKFVVSSRESIDLETGGLMIFVNTLRSKRFVKFCRDNINLFDITADEGVFNDAYESIKPTILNIPTSYKDESFNEASHMWSGHGDVKSYNQIYINEQKKYEDSSDHSS